MSRQEFTGKFLGMFHVYTTNYWHFFNLNILEIECDQNILCTIWKMSGWERKQYRGRCIAKRQQKQWKAMWAVCAVNINTCFQKSLGGKERHYKLTKAARQFFTGPGQPLGAFDKEYRVRAREHAITERLQPNSFLLIMLCISLKVVWALN